MLLRVGQSLPYALSLSNGFVKCLRQIPHCVIKFIFPFFIIPFVMSNRPNAFPDSLLEQVRNTRIIAVVVIDNPEQAVPLANCLLESGIRAIELTLRTPAAFQALKNIRSGCPEMMAGLGTVLFPEQVQQAVDGDAAFAVAPGLNPNIVKAAIQAGLPFAPGITTPSEVEIAVELGCRLLKFFPAEPSGGLPFLKSMNAPYAHLGLEYIPLGGLNENNFVDYLKLDCVPAVGGSWIAPREQIAAGDWSAISATAKRAVAKLA
jgi:2-dehydro-3-deoxyphosphogluconate aldolase/(4S)-4-hydroxy-2-oxoglutarate aldolase